MPFIFSFLLKVSISLLVVYLFYQFVLRKLTFYNWNRFYFLIYTLVSFLVPFIDISSLLVRNNVSQNTIVRFIPSVSEFDKLTGNSNVKVTSGFSFSGWNILIVVVAAGAFILAIRLIIQLFSFKKIISKAKLIADQEIKIYQVEQSIIPFSFGKSIFINRELHDERELQEIIRHELVHVRQLHTADIVWSELICIINWYNPAAWLIRKSIRQNLEFIADQNVLQSGIDKKLYQYLLLKVIGNNHFSIAQNFNFSSLKKRIAMMNKMKSARVQLGKFLLIMPVVAILLVAFRKQSLLTQLTTAGVTPTSVMAAAVTPASITSRDLVSVTPSIKDQRLKFDTVPGKTAPDQNVKIGKYTPDSTLWIVDDKELSSAEGQKIDPETVKEVTVLKGEKAIEKYKDKGRWGAIEITTKSGSPQDTTGPLPYKIFFNKGQTDTVPDQLQPITVTGVLSKLTTTTAAGDNSLKEQTVTGVKKTETSASMLEPVTVSGMQSKLSTAVSTGDSTLNEKTVIGFKREPVSVGNLILKINNKTSESELKQMVTDLKANGYIIVINKMDYRNQQLVYLRGTLEKKGIKKSFTISDFSAFTVEDSIKENGKVDFNFSVNGGSLVWQ